MLSDLQPSVSKACNRCRARKVKCDLKVPQCSSCIRQNEACNITECISYPYVVVKALQDRINELEARLQTVPTPNGPGTDTVPEVCHDTNGTLGSLQKEAEEVGFLVTGGSDLYSSSKYVGSAAGSTFARIFFKQLNIIPSWVIEQQGSGLEQSLCQATAALPHQPIARALLGVYIDRVHVWWPFLQLPHLRRLFQRIYESPKQCTDPEKFTALIVLALGSSHLTSKDSQSPAMMDFNDSTAYFQTALRFFDNFHSHPRDLFGIQAVLLLAIWMLDSSHASHNNDLWQLSRYIMSAAVEAGLHRHNTDWGFTADELETRNRTWWCTYNLERQVATLTGRVLSIRDHAVHAMLPRTSTFDDLSPPESAMAPAFHKHKVELVRHMISLRRIGGRILESIYIARGPNGTAMHTTFQQICSTSDKIRQDLDLWGQNLEAMALNLSREYSEMKIEYCLLQLLLYRPSPTFMVPSREMASYCSKAASTAIHHWSVIAAEYGISAVCRCFRHLHDVLLVGLAALYCDWQAMTLPQSANGTQRAPRHLSDTATCLDLIDRGIPHMKASPLTKYKELFQAVRSKVYSKASFTGASPNNPMTMGPVLSPDVDAMSQSHFSNDIMYSMGSGMEAYINQVSEYLDGGGFNVDEALDTWYDALMGEIQSGGDSHMD